MLDNKVEDNNHVNTLEAQGKIYIYFSSLFSLCLFPDATLRNTQFSDVGCCIQICSVFLMHVAVPLFYCGSVL